MRHSPLKPSAVLLLVSVFAATPQWAFAQGGVTSTLSGIVFDSSGAVVPGASITVKNNATAAITPTVSGADGLFTIPALEPGTYTVSVALQGFKTAILGGVRLNAGIPASVKAVLQ